MLGVLAAMFMPRGAVGSAEYQLWRWETRTLLDNAFARLGIGPEPDDEAGLEAVTRYFALTSELRAELAKDSPDLGTVGRIEDERARHENVVERLYESYITEAIEDAGLERSLPLFSRVRFTWPPVDFELTNPPQLLVRSPRDVIRRDGDTLLKNDLGLAELERLETKTSDENQVSIVVSIGGLAAYPAIVHGDRTYDSTLRTSSHEWVHHYLAFYPLGQQWGKGGAAHALNETTADIAGDEIARLILERHPIELPAEQDGRAPARPAPTLDFNEEMRALRLEVDGLLAEGKITEAEALMESKRLEFNANGFNIRKLNQAYFAFYGTYAESPQSSDPIGPKVREVWERTQHLGLFLGVMREIKDVEELDRALERLGAVPGDITAAP